MSNLFCLPEFLFNNALRDDTSSIADACSVATSATTRGTFTASASGADLGRKKVMRKKGGDWHLRGPRKTSEEGG